MKWSNGPLQLHNLSSSSNINWEKYRSKGYLHFDERIHIEHMKANLLNKDWVASYAFLPFIHFEMNFKRFVTIKEIDEQGQVTKRKERGEPKKRKIFYSAHKDGYIYKFYGDLLNNAYNIYASENEIDDNVVAYRNNKLGKNNIDFAFEVFDHLFKFENAVVISSDFTKYFDNISHKTLKRNIRRVLGIKTLERDWYQVFKNLTQFTYVNREDIDKFLEEKYGRTLNKKIKTHQINRIMTSSEFRKSKKKYLKPNPNSDSYGIPQGSSMSAVCSNVHLIDFDKEISEWCKQKSANAMYRRYCDDLIVIIPLEKQSTNEFATIRNELFEIINKYKSDGLDVQQKKTEIRLWNGDNILDEQLQPSKLDYLGFVTDGQMIQLREKSLFNYYTRAYRKAKTVKRIEYATERPGPKRSLYDLYTHLGFEYKKRGNFVTYAYKAHNKMCRLPVKSLIKKQVKRHWGRIHRRL
ncbi:reverse transcriptase domain-containing protein [Lysinibacillus sp. LK3]|uniref:reverse transcriptase domain-containing protein n=1 Tax=Lysinibacillus sp. LK3 TaxID=1628207 RepID=UPI00065422B3|nr:reverse transcriptase domain-containing protein [Lysinibacillus sp. LK3]KMN41282.1 reverse transcriptase [Lysinibacillus sp. LK3]